MDGLAIAVASVMRSKNRTFPFPEHLLQIKPSGTDVRMHTKAHDKFQEDFIQTKEWSDPE